MLTLALFIAALEQTPQPFCRHPLWIAFRATQALVTGLYLYANQSLQAQLRCKNKQMLAELGR